MTSSGPPSGPVQPDIGPIYLKYGDIMRAQAHVELGAQRAHLADDVVSDVLRSLVSARAAGTLSAVDNWEAYLVASVRDRARRLGERESTRAAREIQRTGMDRDEPNTPDPDADEQLGRVVDAQTVSAAVTRLPERQRLVIWHTFWLRGTLSELASQLGVSSQALGQQRQQALETLRREWTDDGRM